MPNQYIVGGSLYPIYFNEKITQTVITPGSYVNVNIPAPPPTGGTFFPTLLLMQVG